MGTHPIFESDFDCLTAMVVDKYEQYFKDHNRTKEFSGHSAKVHTVAWSCDGKRLASGSLDKTACVFTLDKDRLVKETSYKGHGDAVDQLVWHPTNPSLFATASGDNSDKGRESEHFLVAKGRDHCCRKQRRFGQFH